MILIHVEIESTDSTTSIKSRLPYDYHHLRDKYELRVVPVVLYFKVGLNGIGVDDHVEHVWTRNVNTFRYLYVGLPALNAGEYLQGDCALGVALSALMNVPPERVAWLGAEALLHLATAQLSHQQRFLLADCAQAYLPTTEDQRRELDALLETETYREIKAVNQRVYDKGRQAERVEIAQELIRDRFGAIDDVLKTQVAGMSAEELRQLILNVQKANSLAELGLSSPR